MLAVAVLSLGILPAAPVARADVQQPHLPHGDCKRLTRQIAHYADVVDMARERDDDMWEEHTLAHIGRLSERRARLCPQYAQAPAGQQLVQMLKLLKTAAKIARILFTWGVI
jgi:hypothetical protein